MSPEKAYDDLTVEELADEISGLDDEIENCQNYIAKMRKSLRQKIDLRESLIEISARQQQSKGWHKKFA